MVQDQETLPAPSAVFPARSREMLIVPDGVVYMIEQIAPGEVLTDTLAVWPGALGVVIETTCVAVPGG
jgi:hypothetical protein